jgi:subtilisin family serine protease
LKNIFLLLTTFLVVNAFGQSHYAVTLKDKDADRVTQFINNPTKMLSQRAIARRQRLKISFDAIDVPIDINFVNQCRNTGSTILAYSKWLNTIFVDATTSQINQIKTFSFVKEVKLLEAMSSGKQIPSSTTSIPLSKKESIYGNSDVFVKQIKIDFLHNKGFTGDNIQIAILDAGFLGVNTIEAFDELRNRNGILGTYNFVANQENVYRDSNHGTMVLSTMATNKPNIYLGTAYNADYWLFTTEDNYAETPREEMFWIEAIEFADSVGVDVVNSSLGYRDFDGEFLSYTYDDMNGETTFISRAASIGGQKGILVVISAGNEGRRINDNKIWAPADAKNIITVGSVNSSGTISPFSSYGPSADGRIKPDVAAMGTRVPLYSDTGEIVYNNGTSFSSPIVAGSVTCLRQAFPNSSVSAIIDALHVSADNYDTPDDRTGYGIANFESAYIILKNQLGLDKNQFNKLSITPNPVENNLRIEGINNNYKYYISDVMGRIVLKGNAKQDQKIDVSILNKGYYQIILQNNGNTSLPFIKK